MVPLTFREMAQAIGMENTPADGDPDCGCVYCATGMGGWCSSRPMPLNLPRFKPGTTISFKSFAPLRAHTEQENPHA